MSDEHPPGKKKKKAIGPSKKNHAPLSQRKRSASLLPKTGEARKGGTKTSFRTITGKDNWRLGQGKGSPPARGEESSRSAPEGKTTRVEEKKRSDFETGKGGKSLRALLGRGKGEERNGKTKSLAKGRGKKRPESSACKPKL